MISFSNTKLVGRLGKDPDVRSTQNGKRVATLSVAVGLGYGDNRQTEWYTVVAWEKTAEFIENHLHKGDIVYVDGIFRSREWVTKDGENRRVFEIQARDVQGIYDTKNSGYEEITGDDGSLPF